MNRTITPVVVGIIERDEKYLFTQRADIGPEYKEITKGKSEIWQCPGGGLEFSEDSEEGLRREIREEVGIEINVITLLPKLYSDVRSDRVHLLIIPFFCTMKNPADTITINDEASEYKWVSIEEAKQMVTLPFGTEMLELAEKIRKNL